MMNAPAVRKQQPPVPYSVDHAANNDQQFDFQFFTDYTNDLTDTKKSKTTEKSYKAYLKSFILWLADNGITQPGRNDIKAYREYLSSGDLSAGTQSQYLRAVKQFFKYLQTADLYKDISAGIDGPQIRHDIHKRDALSRDDVLIIEKAIDRTTETGKRDYAMFLLGVIDGLRCVEMSRANIDDIKTLNGKKYLYVQGKGHNEPDAPVLLIQRVDDAITDYLQARTDDKSGKSPLFVSTSNRSKGGRINPATISTLIKRILIAAGYDSDRLTAHSLRHTSGTAAYKASGNIYETQHHMRHVDPATTEIYVHAEERNERETEQQIDNYFHDNDTTADDRRAALQLVNELDQAELKQVIDYINTIKKGETA